MELGLLSWVSKLVLFLYHVLMNLAINSLCLKIFRDGNTESFFFIIDVFCYIKGTITIPAALTFLEGRLLEDMYQIFSFYSN